MKLPSEKERPLLNILMAYPYIKRCGIGSENVRLLSENTNIFRMLIDSGAFTAYQAKKTIELNDYCRFLETFPLKPWGYFVLDVIGDAKATLANYLEMLRRGFSPIPIFTRGTDPKILEEYFSTSDLVGIGGLVKTPKARGFVNGIMEYVGDRRVHLLGFVDMAYLKTYRPFSCDSSGWDNGSYGNIRVYMGHGRFKTINRKDCSVPLPQEIQQRLMHLGVDPASLAKEVVWRGEDRINFRTTPRYFAMVRSVVEFCYDLEMNCGTKHFLATTGAGSISQMIIAWKRLADTRTNFTGVYK